MPFSIEFVNIFGGHLKPNNILATAEHLLANEIHGPESFIYKNGKTNENLSR